jgi:hypothetical protein
MKEERPPYDFDELMKILEDLRTDKIRVDVNTAKTIYTICLKIKELEKSIEAINNWIDTERGYDE